MAKASKAKIFVLLKSTISHHSYTVWKNTKTAKLALKKYDPVKMVHALYEEKKAPNPKKS